MITEAATHTREQVFALLEDGLTHEADNKVMHLAESKDWGKALQARLRALCELVGQGGLTLIQDYHFNSKKELVVDFPVGPGDVSAKALNDVFLNFPPAIHEAVVESVLNKKGVMGVDRRVASAEIELEEYAGAVADLMGEHLIRVDLAGVLVVGNESSPLPVI